MDVLSLVATNLVPSHSDAVTKAQLASLLTEIRADSTVSAVEVGTLLDGRVRRLMVAPSVAEPYFPEQWTSAVDVLDAWADTPAHMGMYWKLEEPRAALLPLHGALGQLRGFCVIVMEQGVPFTADLPDRFNGYAIQIRDLLLPVLDNALRRREQIAGRSLRMTARRAQRDPSFERVVDESIELLLEGFEADGALVVIDGVGGARIVADPWEVGFAPLIDSDAFVQDLTEATKRAWDSQDVTVLGISDTHDASASSLSHDALGALRAARVRSLVLVPVGFADQTYGWVALLKGASSSWAPAVQEELFEVGREWESSWPPSMRRGANAVPSTSSMAVSVSGRVSSRI